MKKLQTRYETDSARMAAYEGFLLGEHVATFSDWNVQIRDPKTGKLEPLPPPPMPF
jgi:hypothetical protein